MIIETDVKVMLRARMHAWLYLDLELIRNAGIVQQHRKFGLFTSDCYAGCWLACLLLFSYINSTTSKGKLTSEFTKSKCILAAQSCEVRMNFGSAKSEWIQAAQSSEVRMNSGCAVKQSQKEFWILKSCWMALGWLYRSAARIDSGCAVL